MESPNSKGANNMVVGLFVLVACIVGFGFITFIGKTSLFSTEVTIKAFFKDARGLNVGAPVFMSGIQVGRVSAKEFPEGKLIELAPKDFQSVVVSLTLSGKYLKHVKVDSEVEITSVGMLGDKIIVISPGTEQAASLQEDGMLLVKEQKELSEYFAKGGNLVEDLSATAVQLNRLITDLNSSGRLSSILANLDKASANFAKASQGTEDLGPAIKSLKAILAKVEKGDGTLGALINDSSLHEDLRVLLGGAQRSATVRFMLRQAISSGDKKSRDPEVKEEKK